jgi:iron complex transport system permease protein
MASRLNAFLLGEPEAGHLGVRVEALKRTAVGLTCLSVAGAVAFAGVIGFVGLVAPHMVRVVCGPDYRVLLPASALLGASLLPMADLVSRTVAAPVELPIGLMTALLGAPVFLWLLAAGQPRRAV